ncbi:MAG: hypothetical protein LBF49_01090 [Puniceicoccales bacterium]|jgi:LPS-assembly protein|nr:hypothetical protein [Puniceicoccales bacterium]
MLLGNVSKKFLTIPLLIISSIIYGGVEVSSDKPVEYIADRGELVVGGNAKIEVGNFIIQADEITFQKEQATAIATGNVKIDNGKVYIVADRIFYDMNSDLIHAYDSKVKVHNYYFHIENIDLDTVNDVQTGTNTEIFHGPADRTFIPSVFVKSFEITNEESIRAKGTRFKIGSTTILYLPSAEIDLSSHPFYLEQNYGLNRTNGAYLQNNFYFGVTKGLKLGGLLDFYAKRGILFGPALKIDGRSEKNQISSEIQFGFIQDRANEERKGFDIKNKPIPPNRYFLEFAHRQHYDDQIDIIAKTTVLSDSEAERDFRKAWYDRNQQPESFVEISYRGQNYIASAFGQFEPNTFYNTTQQIPELHIAYLPTKLLDTKLIHNAHLGAVRLHNRRKDLYGITGISRADIYHGISLPLEYKNFLTIKPIFGMRALIYDRNIDGKTYGKGILQGGFDINMKITGQSDYANETFGINGLKHVITPTIQYRVIPSGNGSTRIPKFHGECFSTEIPPIDLDDMRNVDDIGRQNMLRLGIKNSLYTQSGSCVPKQLMRMDVFQDILFARNYDNFRQAYQKKFPDTHLAVGIYPASWFNFDIYTRVDPTKLHLHELKTITVIKDADFWKLAFSTNYLKFDGSNPQRSTEQYGLFFTFNLSSQTSITIESRYNARIHKFSQQRFSLSSTLWNSWLVNLGITIRTHVKREDHVQFDWHLRLLDF